MLCLGKITGEKNGCGLPVKLQQGLDAQYTGVDEQNREFRKLVKAGDRIGISGSGAISQLKNKKGHFIALHWTGNKVSTKMVKWGNQS